MSTLIYAGGKKIRKEHPYKDVFDKYAELYQSRFGNYPEINYGACGRLINQRLKNHSKKGLVKIIEMFFKEEKSQGTIFDLKVILSSFHINKYAPKLKLDSKLYANAEEWNKEVY